MKVPMQAKSIEVGELVWLVPDGRKAAVKVRVTSVIKPLDSNIVLVEGNRQTSKGLVAMKFRLFAFTQVSLEMEL